MGDLDELEDIIKKGIAEKTDQFILAMKITKLIETQTECAVYMMNGNWTKGTKKDIENFRKMKAYLNTINVA
jgi:hypothetical protein